MIIKNKKRKKWKKWKSFKVRTFLKTGHNLPICIPCIYEFDCSINNKYCICDNCILYLICMYICCVPLCKICSTMNCYKNDNMPEVQIMK